MTQRNRVNLAVAFLCFTAIGFASAQEVDKTGEVGQETTAQEAKNEPNSTDRNVRFEKEIVVTAQKREQALKNVPISLTVFPKSMLQDLDINNTLDLPAQTPNLRVMQSYISGNGVRYSIRGVGSKTNTDEVNSGPVAVHQNQVAFAFPIATTGLLHDIQQVEALRGPQGDLFGLNTTGGTINMITAKPSGEFAAGVFGEVGSYDFAKVDAYVSGPLSERWSTRLALATRQRMEGWQANVLTGEKYGKIDQAGGRLSIRFAGENVLADVEVHSSYDKSDPLLGRGTNSWTTVLGHMVEPVEGYTDVKWSSRSPFPTTAKKPFLDNREFGLTGNLFWDLGGVSLISVTGFQDFDGERWVDADGSEFLVADIHRATNVESFSQELRVETNSTMPLYWMAGLYFGQDEVNNFYIGDLRDNPFFPAVIENDQKLDRNAWAVFGRTEVSFGERWRLALGLRYSTEKRNMLIDGTKLAFDPLGIFAGIYEPGDILTGSIDDCLMFGDCEPGSVARHSIDDNDTSGKLLLSHFANDAWNLYLSVSKGFKSGGFLGALATNPDQYLPHKPERLWAYEIGAKSSLAHGSIMWNTALFYYDYEDQQVSNHIVSPLVGPLDAIVNAPQSTIYGLETELLWHSTTASTISQGLGLQRGTYDNFLAVNPIAVLRQPESDPDFLFYSPEWVNMRGKDIGFPEIQYNGLLEYRFSLSNSRQIQISMDYTFQSGLTPLGEATLTQPAYWLFNGRLIYRLTNGLEIGIWGRNLSNEKYLIMQGPWTIAHIQIVGMPRTIGASVRWAY